MGRLQRHQLGHPVRFTNPTTQQPEYGQIVAEVWPREPDTFSETAPDNDGWREGAFVAQLIEWPNGYRSVRITYYVRRSGARSGDWTFGGQYAPSMSLEDCEELVRGLAESRWWEEPNEQAAAATETI